MAVNDSKITASSLLEVVVALVVICVVLGLAMGVYSNVARASFSLQHTKATLELERVAQTTKMEAAYVDGTISSNGFLIERTILPFAQEPALAVLHLAIHSESNHLIAERKELIRIAP